MTTIIEQDSVGSFFLNGDSPVKANAPHTYQYFSTIQKGLDYLLGHIEPPIWPRTISTYTTDGRQVIAYKKEEAIARFKRAKLLDCRINAYPSYIGWKEVNRQAPDFLFTDLDLSRFKSSKEALDRGLNKKLKNIKEKFKDDTISPSVLWSGNGYHIYLPVKAFILELESVFAEFEAPSRQFIQWTEQFLTNYKADPCHSRAVRRILAPYLINIKKSSYDETFVNINNWLAGCNVIRKLDFNPDQRIKYDMRSAIRIGYLPISFNVLEVENRDLYGLISNVIRKS